MGTWALDAEDVSAEAESETMYGSKWQSSLVWNQEEFRDAVNGFPFRLTRSLSIGSFKPMNPIRDRQMIGQNWDFDVLSLL